MKAPIDGGTPPVTLTTIPDDAPQGIAVDASYVYWVTMGGSIMKMAK